MSDVVVATPAPAGDRRTRARCSARAASRPSHRRRPPTSLRRACDAPDRRPARAAVARLRGRRPERRRDAEHGGPAAATARARETIDLLEERDAGDDAYLAELRKAMTDESPLGPREEGDIDPLFDSGSEPSRTRFGRRR